MEGRPWRAAVSVVLAAIAIVVSGGRQAAGGGPTEPAAAVAAGVEPFPVVPGSATGAAPQAGARGADPIELREVLPLGGHEPETNDSNPVWSPDGSLIAFERSRGDGKEIVIARPDGSVVETVSKQTVDDGPKLFLLPGGTGTESYNAGISWSPTGKRVVFMSNGGEGNYDIYLREPGAAATRLTDHKEKEGHAHWSPVADNLVVLVSGRTGEGDVYLMDVSSRELTRLTEGGEECLYPRWSPDGRKVAMMCGSNENHDIHVIGDVSRPRETTKKLSTRPWDDIRPAWSPDGRKIAFYTNFNPEGDSGVWSIVVIDSDGMDSGVEGMPAARLVAMDVITDVETGPAWMPDSAGIVYVKNDRQEYNPIYISDLETGVSLPVRTETKMNHDVACSPEGAIAFRAQVDQWDRMFVAKLGKRAPYR